MTNLWIEKPKIVSNMGTNMNQSDYEKLCGKNEDWKLTEEKAIFLVNKEFGFEISRIKIVTEVENFTRKGNCVKPYQKFNRIPQYCATDYNYIRFDVNGWQYEMINGTLEHYWN